MFTVSAVIITFGISNKQLFGPISILFLPMVIGVANLVAILYIHNRGRWISVHQQRAKRVLEIYISELYTLEQETAIPPLKWETGRTGIQSIIHYLFILIALILLAIFSLESFGVSIT